MSDPKDASIVQFGRIQFNNGAPARPETSHADGNVTIKTAAQPGQPPQFLVNFVITAPAFGKHGQPHHLNWTIRLPQANEDARHRPYSEIEKEAFAALVGQIRALADALESELAELQAGDTATAEAPD